MIATLLNFFHDIFRYREYLKQSVARDMRKKYKRSVLGYLWSMLNPLLMMIILAIVFGGILKQSVEDYSVFLLAGMLPWGYFDGVCNASLGVIRNNARILDQVTVPKYIFLIAVAMSELVTFALTLVPLLVLMLATNHKPHLVLLSLPLVIVPLLMLSIGVSLVIAVASVFFDDTQHLLGILLRALYFLCPILYSREMLSPDLVQILEYSPIFGIIEAMRGIIYYGQLPDVYVYASCFVSSFVALIVGLWIFVCNDKKFVYFI